MKHMSTLIRFFSFLRYRWRKLRNLMLFFILFFGTHFLWELTIDGDLFSQRISFIGYDLTSFFHQLSRITANVCWELLTLLNIRPLVIHDTLLHYITPQSGVVNIIWGCTGFKQMLMFMIIMLMIPGIQTKKIWYIPLGLFILWAYNIIRICTITYFTGLDVTHFDFWHSVFNDPYYGLIFLLWVFWEEVLNSDKRTNKEYDKFVHLPSNSVIRQ